jgi:short-subunit dehydrogenase
MSESLTSELSETNVHVTTVFPGAIFTDIKMNSGLPEKRVKALNPKGAPKGVTSPSVAVEAIIEGVKHKKSRICIGKDSKTMNMFYRLNPTFACKLIYNKMKDKINQKAA